jgi:hypothetical protein
MKNIDPDVKAALLTLSVNGDRKRAQSIRARQRKQLDATFETHLELLIDEVERVIPRTHPDFMNVLLLAVVKKATRHEPEFKSYLEEGVPEGF